MPTPEIKSLSIEEDEEKDIPNRWNILLTYDEIELLAKIVWLESSGEDDKGQQGVVEVVFNRMVHWDLEGSLYDVLSHKNAFSTWKNRNKAKPTEKEYTNIYKVLAGETDILDFDTVYFSTEARNDDIAAHIGHHYFCRYEYSCPEDKE
jgi:N-acetylmuramoyl-L-alanine amidase